MTFSKASRCGYVSVIDSLGHLLGCCCLHAHSRDITRSLLLDVCPQTTAHRVLGSVLIQLGKGISDDIIFPWSDAHSRYPSRNMLPDFILNLPSSSHECSSGRETCAGFGFVNLEA